MIDVDNTDVVDVPNIDVVAWGVKLVSLVNVVVGFDDDVVDGIFFVAVAPIPPNNNEVGRADINASSTDGDRTLAAPLAAGNISEVATIAMFCTLSDPNNLEM